MDNHALIIDDNPMNGDVLGMLLANQGVTHTLLESPRSLADILEQLEQIGIIFLDLEMPHHNGFDILNDLRADPRLEGVPIVAYTVHISEIDEARTAGFDGFLGKPLNTQKFPDQLNRIMNGMPVWEIN